MTDFQILLPFNQTEFDLMLRLLSVLLVITAGCATIPTRSVADATAVEHSKAFSIDDYFSLQKVTELALSSDGEMMVYAVTQQSLTENKPIRSVFISPTTPEAIPMRIGAIQNARNFAWIPDRHELAFLLNVEGVTQVLSIDPKTKKIIQHTNSRESATAFRFAADGVSLAWVTQSTGKQNPNLYDQLFHNDEGVLIDADHTFFYHFVNPKWPSTRVRPSNELWLKRSLGKNGKRMKVPGSIKNFYWSSDTKYLSVSYVDHQTPFAVFVGTFTSLGVLDTRNEEFAVLARARMPSDGVKGLFYTGGEWIPGKNKLFIRRTEQEDRWTEVMQWSIADVTNEDMLGSHSFYWHPIPDIYGWNPEPAFLPVSETEIYSERYIRAWPTLYEISSTGTKKASIFNDVDGAATKIRFSGDHLTAIFVNENFDRPPEIFIWRNKHGVTQLTQMNEDLAAKPMPTAREIRWKGKDGVSVQGWLLEPPRSNATINEETWPLITFVHGGPGAAITNEFSFHFAAGYWPYPFEVFTQHGIAVFFPNYRGTGTFGYHFRKPSALDKEPADDIIYGIEYLIAEGVADPERLAISGHSHGAWLAPLVMTKTRNIQAASFAEGAINKTVNYNLMAGYLNREVLDVQYGGSLYENPARYIEMSPDMDFQGLDTAILFEAGAESAAINMLGPHKAAKYAKMPSEFFVYPKTGHGSSTPRMQYESATRNLDWFRFWLHGYEDPDTNKADQYVRWRAMRSDKCSRRDTNEPTYCEFEH